VRVISPAPVLENPRGDSFVVGTVDAGVVLEVFEQRGLWFLVGAPATVSGPSSWTRAWILARYLDVTIPGGGAAPRVGTARRKPKGERLVRGFAQAGGSLFRAKNSFDTIFGSRLGSTYGFGGQWVFP